MSGCRADPMELRCDAGRQWGFRAEVLISTGCDREFDVYVTIFARVNEIAALKGRLLRR